MEHIRKTILNSKCIVLLIAMFLSSCNKPHIYFDIKKQEIIECNNFAITNIYVTNDSINEKGFFIEPPIHLKWNNSNKPPFLISLTNISSYYQIYSNNKIINNFKLMNNTSYTISQAVSGKSTFSIRVWTNNQGSVYKASHSSCDNSVSLDMK
jgi:hypothetical protein